MNASLSFTIFLDYDRTTYDALKRLCGRVLYDSGTKCYWWTFPLRRLPDVKAVLGKTIEFAKQDTDLLAQSAVTVKQQVVPEPYKGKGSLQVVFQPPNLFVITTFINKKQRTFLVPVETVQKTWQAIRKQPLNKPVKSKTLAEHWCDELGITRYHRKTGSFDGDKMYGDRPTYFKYYYALKVLAWHGAIEHTKTGQIIRLTDSWQQQTKIAQ